MKWGDNGGIMNGCKGKIALFSLYFHYYSSKMLSFRSLFTPRYPKKAKQM